LQLFFITHGSANSNFGAEFVYVIDLFRLWCPLVSVGCWILEFSRLPLLSCFGASANISVIVPVVLFASKHVKHDVCLICGFLQSLDKRKVVVLMDELCSVVLSAQILCYALKKLVLARAVVTNMANFSVVVAVRGGSEASVNMLAYSLSRALWEAQAAVGVKFASLE